MRTRATPVPPHGFDEGGGGLRRAPRPKQRIAELPANFGVAGIARHTVKQGADRFLQAARILRLCGGGTWRNPWGAHGLSRGMVPGPAVAPGDPPVATEARKD